MKYRLFRQLDPIRYEALDLFEGDSKEEALENFARSEGFKSFSDMPEAVIIAVPQRFEVC